jgi:hypothetical protein
MHLNFTLCPFFCNLLQTDSPFRLTIATVTQGAFFQVEEKRAN